MTDLNEGRQRRFLSDSRCPLCGNTWERCTCCPECDGLGEVEDGEICRVCGGTGESPWGKNNAT